MLSFLGYGAKKPTKQELVVDASKELYKSKGLKDGVDYVIYDVPLKTIPGYISVFEAGFGNKDVLIMIHGYGASSAFNFKQFPDLSKKFHIYSIDLYGFGASYRYDITFKDSDHALSTFLTSIHETLEAINKAPYYIAAHSLGGYLACHYLAKYKPDNVKGVMLQSPAGTTKLDPEMIDAFYKKFEFGFAKKCLFNFAFYLLYDRKWSPLSLAFFMPNSTLMKRFFGNARLKLTEEEKKLMINYYLANLNYGDQGMSVLGYF